MLILKKCCCFNIRTGGIIIGWLGLIGGIMSVLNALFALPRIDERFHMMKDTNIDPEVFKHMMEAFIKISLFDGAVEILSNSALLWGINKNNKLGLIPWLMTTMIKIVGGSIAIFGVGVFFYFTEYPWAGFILHSVGFLFGGLAVYLWCCILSIYNQIKLEETNPFHTGNEEGRILKNNVSPTSMTNALAPPPYKSIVTE